MPKNTRPNVANAAVTPRLILEPLATFTLAQVEEAYGLDRGGLADEVSFHRLEISRIQGREVVTGEQIKEWLDRMSTVDKDPENLEIARLREESGIMNWACEHLSKAMPELMGGPCPGYYAIKRLTGCLAGQYGDDPFPLAAWEVGAWFCLGDFPEVDAGPAISQLVQDGVLEDVGEHWFEFRRGRMYHYLCTDETKRDAPHAQQSGSQPTRRRKREKGIGESGGT
jgi:hypothetical protein